MNELQFGEFALDPSLRQLRRGAEVIALSGKAFDLLFYMAMNPGRPLRKADILDEVWHGAFVEESNLSQNIFLLRKALGEDCPILTLPGLGYQFAARVVQSAHVESPTSATGAPALSTLQATHTRLLFEEDVEERIDIRRSPIAIAFIACMFLLLGVVGWLGWQRYEDRVGGAPVRIVLSGLEGTTGDTVLDHMLSTLTRIELAQSPFVTLVPTATVKETLQEMRHKPDEVVTLALARDICERTGSQAVIQESVTRIGSHFLLTEQATNCLDGTSLGEAHREATRAEDLPKAIMSVNAAVRHSLGESRRMIARFNAPLMGAETESLEALKAYSEGTRLGNMGKLPEAIALLKKAVAEDPNFATAYLNLGIYANNAYDLPTARQYFQKAYELKAMATEPMRLYIVANYSSYITGDLYESLRNYQVWIALYPHDLSAWDGLSNVYRQLGMHAESAQAAQHTVALNPKLGGPMFTLAEQQMMSGDVTAARATAATAIRRGVDDAPMHDILFRLGYLAHDTALMQEQERWEATANPASMLLSEVDLAVAQGRIADSKRIFAKICDDLRQQGLKTTALLYQQDESGTYAEIGYPEEANRLLHLAPIDPNEADQLSSLVAVGDTVKATELLKRELEEKPRDTLWQNYYGPIVKARLALAAHRPSEAIQQLESTRPFEALDPESIYLRGLCDLEAGQPQAAQVEFERILAHPWINSVQYAIALSRLQLARSLAAQQKFSEAAVSYRLFLDLWAHADPDEPLLLRARTELAALAKPKSLKP